MKLNNRFIATQPSKCALQTKSISFSFSYLVSLLIWLQ